MTRSRGPRAAEGAAPRAARSVRRDWHDLAAPAESPAAFDPAMLPELPEPARRWLSHAITPGTPMWRSVEDMTEVTNWTWPGPAATAG